VRVIHRIVLLRFVTVLFLLSQIENVNAQLFDSVFFARSVVFNLGSNVNSTGLEFCPSLSISGELLFASDRPDGSARMQHLWIAPPDGKSGWSLPLELTQLNSNADEGGGCLTIDSKNLYFATSRNTTEPNDVNIWTAEFDGRDWKNIRSLPGQVNTMSWESQPFITTDGKSLFFASNRPGKVAPDDKRNVDLFVSHLLPDSTWNTPVNLGNIINASGYDASPFLSPDGTILYFSSDGHGAEGIDIFQSKWVGPTDTDWSEPIRLPPPINSQSNDLFPYVTTSGTMYFTSDRPGTLGGYDIWVASQMPQSVTNRATSIDNSIAVFPNPATTKVTIYYDLAHSQYATFSILDLVGRVVRNANLPDARRGAVEADLSSIASGIYTVVVKTDTQNQLVQRVILTK
jgi:Tol biopolymer transport system component